MVAPKTERRDLAARIAELDRQTAGLVAKGDALKERWGDELLSGASTAGTEKELHVLDVEREAVACERAAAVRAMQAEAEAAERARQSELIGIVNSGAASMDTHVAKWLELVGALEAVGAAIEADAAPMMAADRELNPAANDVPDRVRRPLHPEALLKASLANASKVRARGTSQKTAQDARAALLGYASLFVIDADE